MGQDVADFVLKRLREWNVEYVFAYPGDGINGLVAAFGRADNQPQFIQARHEEMAALRGDGLRQVLRPGRGVHGHLGTRGDPPAQRAVRRQARPRPCRRDRRPDGAQRDGRQLPAGGRPAGALQGRGQRLSRRGQRRQPAAERARPGHPHGLDAARPDRLGHPVGPAGGALRTTRPRIQAGAVQRSELRQRDPRRPTTSRYGRPPTSSTRARKSRSSSARVPVRPPRRCEQVADLTGAGVAKALLGKDVLPDDLPYVTGSIGLLGTRPSYELMRDCDTLLIVGSNFPVQPIPAEIRSGPGGSDRHRRLRDRHAISRPS